MISGQGRLPATAPAKWLISGPGPPSAAAPSTSAEMSSRSLSSSVDRLDRIALPDRDRRLDPGFLHDRARRLDEHRLGAQPRFLLHRRLDAAPLDEFRLRDQREDLDPAAGPRRPPRGEAQRRLRLLGLVHHHQIGAHRPPARRAATLRQARVRLRRRRRRTLEPAARKSPGCASAQTLDPRPAHAVWTRRAVRDEEAPSMPIELKMPALSPTMEEGTLAKWLVKEGDTVASGDILAEIETDKATMEFEAVDEGTIAKILVAEGTDEVKVGTVIALIAGEGEDARAARPPAPAKEPARARPAPRPAAASAGQAEAPAPAPQPPRAGRAAARASRRRRPGQGEPARPPPRRGSRAIDLAGLTGSGPGGRIVKADIDGAAGKAPRPPPARRAAAAAPAPPLRRRPWSRPTSRTRRSSSPTCARRSRAA